VPQPRTITRTTIARAARLVRLSHPAGMSVGELASALNVNPSTLRTGGYIDMLLHEHPDLFRVRGRIYNDGERTAILLSMKAAVEQGELEWAAELRARWDVLHRPPTGQTTLDVGDVP